MVHRDAPAPPAVSTNANAPRSLCVPDVLMMTAQVTLTGPGDKQIQARALIDSVTLVSSRVAQLLNLPVTKARVTFSGVQDTPAQASNSLVTLSISPFQVGWPSQQRLYPRSPAICLCREHRRSQTCLTSRSYHLLTQSTINQAELTCCREVT